jgi:membrane protease YdiL (CAAX protease family)
MSTTLTTTGTTTTKGTRQRRSTGPVTIPQYGIGRILAVWAAAALPMAALAWLVAPALADALGGSNALTRGLIIALTAGLVWQFALVVGMVWAEQGTLRFAVVREALWLRAPRSPRTGRVGGRTWFVVIPFILLVALEEMLPAIPHPASRDLGEFFSSHAGHAFMHGAWGWYVVLIVMFVFNTVLGEELLFRGFLLPRMNGTFGRFDWLANGVLFGLYHLHVPWVIPAAMFDAFALAYPTKRYRSAWMGIAVHSAQSVVFAAIGLALVLGT